jgi:NADH-quinone oxidoreductase subunit L
LHGAADHSVTGAFYYGIFIIAVITALLTAFYTFRAYFMTFWGQERFPEEAGQHPHEAPPVMAWPLRVLALCALFIGLVVGPTHLFAGYLQHTPGLPEAEAHSFHLSLMTLSSAVALAGITLAWFLYVKAPELPGRIAAALGPLYRASLHKLYFDEIYAALLVSPLQTLAWLSDWFDRRVIDPLVDIVGLVPRLVSSIPRVFHNGLVPAYALLMWTGVLLCMLFALQFVT